MEGLDDTRGAAKSYERFVRFGSQVSASRDCRGCHQDAGPTDMSWFVDWWAGRKYAQATIRLHRLDSAIAEHEAAVAKHPGDVAARMLLAYLYEAKGRNDEAAAIWNRLGVSSALSLKKDAGQ
jgi:hypothetical protein